MSEHRKSTIRRSLFALALLLGAGLFFAGTLTPVYTDIDLASQIKLGSCSQPSGTSGPRIVEGWRHELVEVKTLRHPLMQGGLSLILASLTLIGFRVLFCSPETGRLQTPKRVGQFFGLGLAVVALSWVSQMHSLWLDLRRGEFPWCADTVIIPMYSLTMFYLALGILLIIGGLVISRLFGELPADILIWREETKSRSWIWTILCGFAALIIAVFGLDGAWRSSFIGTPAAIVAIYAILSARAAILSPKPTPR